MSLEFFGYIATGAILLVLVVPPFLLQRWYFRELSKYAGGERLKEEQSKIQPNLAMRGILHRGGVYTPTRPGGHVANMKEAGELHRRIMAGEFGEDAKKLQVRIYIYFGLWVLAFALTFVLIFALRATVFYDPSRPIQW
ncbi:MAG: hypothetical protein MRY74_09305 [Neomegalonema sp.]|nr:hypothetical protein [Neomegalonema sp.]